VSHPAYATRVERIRTSASLAAAARARELSAAGRDILDLTVGEPDFDTPRHIKDAAIAAIEAGQTKYTAVNGTPELRRAIIEHVRRRTGIGYGDAEVSVSGGAKQVIYLALAATVDRGAEVIIPAPYWVSYPDMVLANDGKPVIVPCPAADGFLLTPEALDDAIGPRTRWVMLNTPSNPTGAVYSAEQLRALADVLLSHPHVRILTDEIYDAIYFGPDKLRSLVSVEPGLADRTVVVNGVSKAYAMTGWRIGYCGGPKEIIQAMSTIQGQSTSNASSISQKAATVALNADQSCVGAMNAAFKERRDFVVRALNALPGVSCLPGAGTFYAFAEVSRAMSALGCRDDNEFAELLLNEAGVAVVPGSGFGAPNHMRLSFACSMQTLEKALARIARLLTERVAA
jgi:aspartate aminotransferase